MKKLATVLVVILLLVPLCIGAQQAEKKALPANPDFATWAEALLKVSDLHREFLAKHGE